MADEFDLDQLDSQIERENKTEKRIKDLSEKVRLTAEERDEKDKLLAQERAEKESLQKERDFLNSFGDVLAKPEYTNAAQFKDKIKEKVLRGYSVEDATTAVLVAEGRYIPPTPAAPQTPLAPSLDSYAGGSAATVHQMTGDKTIQQLNREEKRAKLMDAEARGELSVS